MADYAKKKNDELITLLKERGLPHTGKKADLVKRLEDSDSQGTSSAAPAVKPAIEDEIDWDDEPAADGAKATTEPGAAAIAAGGVGEVSNPADVPNQHVVEDPAKTNTLVVASNPAADSNDSASSKTAPAGTLAAEQKDFSSNAAERTLDEEIEKRRARARRFGLPEDDDKMKLLERAKRFGTSDVPGLLNKALPSDRKRGPENGDSGGRDSKRSRGRPGQGRGQGRRDGGEKPPRNEAPKKEGGAASWMNEQDRAKAEARKAKFAGTTAT